QELRDCQNCRYRHKGLCGNFYQYRSYSSNIVNLQKLEKRLEVSSNLRLDLEPAINLKDLFYEIDNSVEPAPDLKKIFYEIDNQFEPALNLKNLFYEIDYKYDNKFEPPLNLKDLFNEIENTSEPVLNLKNLFYEIKNNFEPVINLKDLFYEIETDRFAEKMADIFPQKAKYDNFKLLTDIQRVLQNCSHLTNKEKALYCQSQRYFMKLYLREINKTL
ncbi:MAG: hypothetical protein ACFFG0_34115, partial [Candidatus Thorarchaeota archaeon]